MPANATGTWTVAELAVLRGAFRVCVAPSLAAELLASGAVIFWTVVELAFGFGLCDSFPAPSLRCSPSERRPAHLGLLRVERRVSEAGELNTESDDR